MSAFGYKIRKALYECYWKVISLQWHFVKANQTAQFEESDFSIGIVTYVDRFENFFKPLIKQLAICLPKTEIIVVVNGYYDQIKQQNYLKQVKSFLSQYDQVKVIDFEAPQSLSKLWNRAIINSKNTKVLVMNDDLKLAPSFARDLAKSQILKEDIALINRSWSHFIISKKIIKEIGYFDERFPGVGNEDEDYECRLVFNDIYISTFNIKGVKNIVFKTKNFSYGPAVETINIKYVKANKLFFNSKWECAIDEQPGFKYVEILNLYVKLKHGMETPDFYNI